MAAKKKRRRILLTKAVDKTKLKDDEIMLAWRDLLQGRQGALIRMDLEDEIMSTSFSRDPYVTAYNEGKKDFARRILLAAEYQTTEVRKNLDYDEQDKIRVDANLAH